MKEQPSSVAPLSPAMATEENPYAPGKARAATRLVVAMSGGVDSSTVAAHMHAQGYEVIGITLQLYDHGAALAKQGACCAGQDIADARNVCQRLGIPHYVLNYESRFRESVMEDFADRYLEGYTPIPCVKCNQTVKFRDLLATARDLQADALLTGHYIQRMEGKHGAELHQAVDATKDQSYFLFATTQEQLDFLHFPLGGLTKDQTRELALSYGLAVADKPDSQDICFVPDGKYSQVVQKLRPGALEPGIIRHIDGRELGTHRGIIQFTLGQRRGLEIASPTPLYVTHIDPSTHTITVGPEEALYQHHCWVEGLNWLGEGEAPKEGQEVEVKLRSRAKKEPAKLYAEAHGTFRIALCSPSRAITPGQACVLYEGARVLGGGWITNRHQQAPTHEASH